MVVIPLVSVSAGGRGYLSPLERFTYIGSIEDACVAQSYRVTDMVCAGCIGNTPEILEVSILILYSDVLLNACCVVGLWQCCTRHPVTVAMISCSLMWLLFLSCSVGEKCNMEVELGAFLFMKRSYSSTHSLTDLTKSFLVPSISNSPARHIAQKVSSRAATWDHYQHFL